GACLEYFSLSEIAYAKIKEAIIRHEIVPGQRLSHDEMVLRLKISQTPIREALSRLVQEGYVTRLTNRGYRVSEMSVDEVSELFGVRQALESHCLSEVLQRITPDGVSALEENIRLYKKAIAKNAPLVDRYLINKDFHMIIAKIAGNRLVCRMLDDTCEMLVLKRRIENVTHGGFTIHRQHSEILKAIKRKDLKQAQELMAVHLDAIKSTLLRQIDITTRAVRVR
ncbi:MAG: GntR family transcriptional regulator, partial [Candidatus Binatia bacterium]